MNIHQFVREAKSKHKSHVIELGKNIQRKPFEEMQEITNYLMQEYIDGPIDKDTGKRKPYYSMIIGLINQIKTARNIDSKDCLITTDSKRHFAETFILRKIHANWAREIMLGKVLDAWVDTKVERGGSILQITETKDDLFLDVLDWSQIIVDWDDLYEGVKIKPFRKTPAQLMAMKESHGWGAGEFDGSIEQAISTAKEQAEDDEQNKKKDNIGNYIEGYEIYGVLPKSALEDGGDENEYVYQLHVVANSDYHDNGEEKGITLFKSEYKDKIFYYCPERVIENMDLGIGSVKELMHAQDAINKSLTGRQFLVDLATAGLMQGQSSKASKKNVFKNLKKGTIIDNGGDPLDPLRFDTSALPHLTNDLSIWQNGGSDIVSIQDISKGKSPASTPYSLGVLQDRNADGPHSQMRKKDGLFWFEVYKERVIPFLIKRAKKMKELTAELTLDEIAEIDRIASENRATTSVLERLEEFEGLSFEERYERMQLAFQEEVMGIDTELKKDKKKRHFTLDDLDFEGVKFRFNLQISDEHKSMDTFYNNVNNLTTSAMNNPQLTGKGAIADQFNQVAETTGIGGFNVSRFGNQLRKAQQSQQVPQVPDTQSVTQVKP